VSILVRHLKAGLESANVRPLSANIRLQLDSQKLINALAYSDVLFITAVKSFIASAFAQLCILINYSMLRFY
jgi:hypothetical protein